MSYSVADMFTLLQFEKGLSGVGLCRETGLKPSHLEVARLEDVLTKYVNNKISERFGPDWNSVENLRDYQRKKNIADNVDGGRLMLLRQEQEYSLKDFGRIVGIGAARLADIEKGTGKFYNWREYESCKKVLKGNLSKVNTTNNHNLTKKDKELVRKESIVMYKVDGKWDLKTVIRYVEQKPKRYVQGELK